VVDLTYTVITGGALAPVLSDGRPRVDNARVRIRLKLLAVLYHQVLDTPELGGGNLYALAVAEHLHRSGLTAPVWIGGSGPAVDEVARRGLSPRSFDQNALRAGGLPAAIQLGQLAWRLRQGRGLVHTHSTFLHGLMARAFRVAGVRCIAHVHIESTDDDYRWAFRRPPHAIVTCAEFLVRHVERALPAGTWKSTRIHAVPNSVDMSRFQPGDRVAEKQRLGAPPDRPLIVMAANLAPHKGQVTAIKATAELRSSGVDADLWLAGVERGGGTSFTEQLETLVGELNLQERVRFLGQRSDMPAILKAADAFVLPSTNEGLPLTILEAQASGVPVLAAPTAGIPEVVVHGETGFLIRADDPAGYARQLRELFRQPALADQLNAAAATRLRQKHTSEAMLRRLREIYDEVLR